MCRVEAYCGGGRRGFEVFCFLFWNSFDMLQFDVCGGCEIDVASRVFFLR